MDRAIGSRVYERAAQAASEYNSLIDGSSRRKGNPDAEKDLEPESGANPERDLGGFREAKDAGCTLKTEYELRNEISSRVKFLRFQIYNFTKWEISLANGESES